MCLSTVYLEKNSAKEKVMQDVSDRVSKDDGLLLVGMFGDKKYIEGRIKRIDSQDNDSIHPHFVKPQK